MSIVDYLYRGAPAGERAAVQTAVQNMPYSTIGKNILAEGAFGKGSNLRGFDFNYQGKGALPTNTIFQKYVKNPATYIKGGLTSIFGGNAPGNIGGGTPAQRQLFEKVATSPFAKAVAPAAPVLRSVFSLPMAAVTAGPQIISSLMAPKTEAGFDYMKGFDEGAITSIADAENAFDFEQFGKDLVAVDAANQAPVNQGGIIDAVPIFASEDIAARNVGVPQDNRFTGIMRNFARGPLFQGGATAGLRLGEIITGAPSIPFALAGGIASQFLPLDRRPSNLDYQYVNNPNNMGGLSVVDNKIVDPSGILSGKNFASGFGSNSLATMYDKEIDRLGDFITDLEEEEDLNAKDKARLDRLQTKQQIARNRLQDFLSSGPTIGDTGVTRNQFAYDYNQAQQNIGSNYDQLDSQDYGGGFDESTGNYEDTYDPGTTE